MLFEVLASTSEAVNATSKRTDKIAALASMLRQLAPEEIVPAVAFAVGDILPTRLGGGTLGVGWATLSGIDPPPATTATLTIADIERLTVALAATGGSGAVARRRELLAEVLAHSTAAEQRLLRSIVGGELRQGALDGVMTAAVARAADVRVDEVRRAAMFTGSLPIAARVALTAGAAGLAAIELSPATPVQPMLATPSEGVDAAIAATGPASVEVKADGARV